MLHSNVFDRYNTQYSQISDTKVFEHPILASVHFYLYQGLSYIDFKVLKVKIHFLSILKASRVTFYGSAGPELKQEAPSTAFQPSPCRNMLWLAKVSIFLFLLQNFSCLGLRKSHHTVGAAGGVSPDCTSLHVSASTGVNAPGE